MTTDKYLYYFGCGILSFCTAVISLSCITIFFSLMSIEKLTGPYSYSIYSICWSECWHCSYRGNFLALQFSCTHLFILTCLPVQVFFSWLCGLMAGRFRRSTWCYKHNIKFWACCSGDNNYRKGTSGCSWGFLGKHSIGKVRDHQTWLPSLALLPSLYLPIREEWTWLVTCFSIY